MAQLLFIYVYPVPSMGLVLDIICWVDKMDWRGQALSHRTQLKQSCSNEKTASSYLPVGDQQNQEATCYSRWFLDLLNCNQFIQFHDDEWWKLLWLHETNFSIIQCDSSNNILISTVCEDESVVLSLLPVYVLGGIWYANMSMIISMWCLLPHPWRGTVRSDSCSDVIWAVEGEVKEGLKEKVAFELGLQNSGPGVPGRGTSMSLDLGMWQRMAFPHEAKSCRAP